MKLVDPEKRPVVVEFDFYEAQRLAKSMREDFTWSETTEYGLYATLAALLEKGSRE